MPPKILLRLGLGFVFVALIIFSFAEHWLKTRIFVPLNVPVNLDTRQLKSPPFQINLHATYFVALWLDFSADDGYQDGRCNDSALLGSQWRIYRLGSRPDAPRQLWDSSGEMTHVWEYHFDKMGASSGRYELEWDLPPAVACLNYRHPRLVVYAGDEDYRTAVAFLQNCCVFVFATGLVLMVLAAGRAVQGVYGSNELPRIFPEMVLRNTFSMVKHAPGTPIHDPPHWPLSCVAVLSILIFTYMIFGPFPSQGLFVSWKNREAVVWEKSPWPDTLAVYVRAPARFFLNGHEVSRTDLPAKLTEQLSRRAEWTVYFEAESDVSYGEAIYAIATIQACGAKLIWITPRTREDWQQESKQSKSPRGETKPALR